MRHKKTPLQQGVPSFSKKPVLSCFFFLVSLPSCGYFRSEFLEKGDPLIPSLQRQDFSSELQPVDLIKDTENDLADDRAAAQATLKSAGVVRETLVEGDKAQREISEILRTSGIPELLATAPARPAQEDIEKARVLEAQRVKQEFDLKDAAELEAKLAEFKPRPEKILTVTTLSNPLFDRVVTNVKTLSPSRFPKIYAAPLKLYAPAGELVRNAEGEPTLGAADHFRKMGANSPREILLHESFAMKELGVYARSFYKSDAEFFQTALQCVHATPLLDDGSKAGDSVVWARAFVWERSTRVGGGISRHSLRNVLLKDGLLKAEGQSQSYAPVITHAEAVERVRVTNKNSLIDAVVARLQHDGTQSQHISRYFRDSGGLYLSRFFGFTQNPTSYKRTFATFQTSFNKQFFEITGERTNVGTVEPLSAKQKEWLDFLEKKKEWTEKLPGSRWLSTFPFRRENFDGNSPLPGQNKDFEKGGIHFIDPKAETFESNYFDFLVSSPAQGFVTFANVLPPLTQSDKSDAADAICQAAFVQALPAAVSVP